MEVNWKQVQQAKSKLHFFFFMFFMFFFIFLDFLKIYTFHGIVKIYVIVTVRV